MPCVIQNYRQKNTADKCIQIASCAACKANGGTQRGIRLVTHIQSSAALLAHMGRRSIGSGRTRSSGGSHTLALILTGVLCPDGVAGQTGRAPGQRSPSILVVQDKGGPLTAKGEGQKVWHPDEEVSLTIRKTNQ